MTTRGVSRRQSNARSERVLEAVYEISTRPPEKNLHHQRASREPSKRPKIIFPSKLTTSLSKRKRFLHGTAVAMYIVGQERRLVDPPSQVVAGVRTVTTNMDGRDALPRRSRPFAFTCKPWIAAPTCTAWKSH